jgi:hypothetical protein
MVIGNATGQLAARFFMKNPPTVKHPHTEPNPRRIANLILELMRSEEDNICSWNCSTHSSSSATFRQVIGAISGGPDQISGLGIARPVRSSLADCGMVSRKCYV